jgi:hypothetical protein
MVQVAGSKWYTNALMNSAAMTSEGVNVTAKHAANTDPFVNKC